MNLNRLNTCITAGLILGLLTFAIMLAVHPARAWQAYLINFLMFSAIAQGGLLFSTTMHITRAKWSGPLSNLAESFTAFFPISFLLLIIMIFGKNHLFPWLHEDLHGKEVWLNLPFLVSRDVIGLLILYGLGLAYLYHSLWFKLSKTAYPKHLLRRLIYGWWRKDCEDAEKIRHRMDVFSILYMLAFAIILSLIGYDLVMAMDPHWYSTLFGAYCFVKAIYIGFGGLIILAALLHLKSDSGFTLKPSQFHDIGKLFFAFCLVWADFFYCQFVVIWYGNISEETHYIITRTMTSPWGGLAWFVFIICFIAPFLLLLSQKLKMMPKFMIALCSVVIIGIWLEHLLLIGPALNHGATRLPLGLFDILMFIGFLALLAQAVRYYLDQFPELLSVQEGKVA